MIRKAQNRGKRLSGTFSGIFMVIGLVWLWAFAAYAEAPEASPSDVIVQSPTDLAVSEPLKADTQNKTGESDVEKPALDLEIEEYKLFRTGSSKDDLDSLRKNRSAKLVVIVQSASMQTGDIKKDTISVSHERDSFRTTGSPTIKIMSKKDENLTFQISFPKITYNGGEPTFGFNVKFKGNNTDKISLGITIAEAEEFYDDNGGSDSESSIGQPVIRLERADSLSPIEAGQTFTLALRVINTSRDSDVEDMTLSFSSGESMYLLDSTNVVYIKQLNTGKSTEIKLNLQAGQELSGASQSLDVEVKFNYYSQNRLTSGSLAQKIIIPVKGGSDSGQTPLRLVHIGNPGVVRAEQSVETMVRLENTSKNKTAVNVSLTIEPTEQIFLAEAEDTKQIGDLQPGQSLDIPIRLKTASELPTSGSQLVGISLKFEYDSGKGMTQGTYSEKIVIPTEKSGGSQTVPAPNIIISSYSYGGEVTAGKVFDLEMEITNTSKNISTENVLMSLNTDEGLSINSSSNTFYISSLAPGAVVKKSVKVQALFQSKIQSPKMDISFKYEYLDKAERKTNTTEEKIAIPVYQPDRLEIQKPEITDALPAGEETTLSIPYVNKGRGQVYNVSASLEGEINVLQRELNLGNFEAGKSGTIDFIVTPQEAGTFTGSVHITYEDDASNEKTKDIPISFEVEEAPAYIPEDDIISDIPASSSKPWPLIIGVPVTILLAIFLLRKKKKREAAKQIENEDGMDGDFDETMDDFDTEEGYDELSDAFDEEERSDKKNASEADSQVGRSGTPNEK